MQSQNSMDKTPTDFLSMHGLSCEQDLHSTFSSGGQREWSGGTCAKSMSIRNAILHFIVKYTIMINCSHKKSHMEDQLSG